MLFLSIFKVFVLCIRDRLPDRLVSWYFEPSQPQRITSGLKTMFSLSPIFFYPARKSSNRKLFKNNKISPDTNVQKTYTNIKQFFFEDLVPSVLPLLKKSTEGQDTLVSWTISSIYQFQNTTVSLKHTQSEHNSLVKALTVSTQQPRQNYTQSAHNSLDRTTHSQHTTVSLELHTISAQPPS